MFYEIRKETITRGRQHTGSVSRALRGRGNEIQMSGVRELDQRVHLLFVACAWQWPAEQASRASIPHRDLPVSLRSFDNCICGILLR